MTTTILVLICWVLAAICIAIGHTLTYKFDKSVIKHWNPKYWKASVSWRSMYKKNIPPSSDEFIGEKFFGSTFLFKFMCDGWSLMRFLSSSFMLISAIIVYESHTNSAWYINLAIFLGISLVKEVVYTIIYKLLSTK